MFKIARTRWEIFGEILADVTAEVFSRLFYFTIMVPFALGLRLFGDPLAIKGHPTWVERPPISNAIDEARRQG